MQSRSMNDGNTAVAVMILLSFCSIFSLVWGMALSSMARGVILDFKIVYFGARVLVQQHDPYNESELVRIYLTEGGERPPEAAEGYRTQMIVASQMYLPGAALLIAPFGLLPWPAAYLIWIALTVCGVTGAAILIWSVASRHSPGLALYIISFILLNSGILFSGGNPAGVAVSLCIIAAWCFVEGRFVYFGILCMAISLTLKPHDAGLVWLYFLMAGATTRKHALKALFITVVVGVIAIAWIQQISPHWLAELQQNVHEYALPGSYNDPGPRANKAIGTGMIIDLQTVTSVIRDEPVFYKLTAYLICAPFLLYWGFLTVRSGFSKTRGWFALAAIAPLAMLPVYHRPYDAKLLLLAIPACASLWSAGRIHAWLSMAFTTTAVVCTSDLPLALLSNLSRGIHIPTGASDAVITVLLMRPAPLALLALGGFNLFHYARICDGEMEGNKTVRQSLIATAANQE